jgi:hypothetical protein
VADGIILEKHGVPAVSIITDSFTASGNAMARRLGMAGYRYTMLPHPIANLTPDECCERAERIIDDVLSILKLDAATATSPRERTTPPEHQPWPVGGGV